MTIFEIVGISFGKTDLTIIALEPEKVQEFRRDIKGDALPYVIRFLDRNGRFINDVVSKVTFLVEEIYDLGNGHYLHEFLFTKNSAMAAIVLYSRVDKTSVVIFG